MKCRMGIFATSKLAGLHKIGRGDGEEKGVCHRRYTLWVERLLEAGLDVLLVRE